MFREACRQNSGGIYGTLSSTQLGNSKTWCNGTGFMIAPGILAMAAHCIHVEHNSNNPRHKRFNVICASDIGQPLESAVLIDEDPIRDVALLRIDNPRSIKSLYLDSNFVGMGTACGSIGFPLSTTEFLSTGTEFNVVERFQSAYISANISETLSSGRVLSTYETNNLMYGGSSGCPGFLVNGNIFGMLVGARINTNTINGLQSMEQVAISLWVPSIDIINLAKKSGIKLN
ncbi:serine protease [Clostridium algoriphilum]|uniref:S1 family peptidase n=1 Tax=Clostridium algoriphilum TaxID=198347 RepID=UPI001CF2E9B6|nr:serine protease [Clostridium algoriphilum]MCB2295490.1 serine protease [Clostridium algoriphilum]